MLKPMTSVAARTVVFFDSRLGEGVPGSYAGKLIYFGRATCSDDVDAFRANQAQYPRQQIDSWTCEDVPSPRPLAEAVEAVKEELGEAWGAIHDDGYKLIVEDGKVRIGVHAPFEESVTYVALNYGLPLEMVQVFDEPGFSENPLDNFV